MNNIHVISSTYLEGDPELARDLENSRLERNPNYKGEFGSYHTEQWLSKFLTEHPTMIRLKEKIRLLTPKNECILIVGPSGTGKELLANALHGPRRGKFIAINCTGLPEHLIESELLGHKKGSFTGAMADKKGLVEEAKGGTIFMDEIGDMPFHLQAKLLRILETMKGRRLGEADEYSINCRFVFATNKPPTDLMTKGLLREDLYWRIRQYQLETLPLSERLADIKLIIDSLNKKFPWDEEDLFTIGNVRELSCKIREWKLEEEIGDIGTGNAT